MPYTPDVEEKQLEAEIKELICYLWDNYIQLYENADEVFVMGVGYAYLGVKMLLLNRGKCGDTYPGFARLRDTICPAIRLTKPQTAR
jgi:histone deacetylase 6